MREIAGPLRTWLDAGEDLALAVVVGVSGSAPRPLGTAMAVRADGTIAGNVSAGCVESAVVERALAILAGQAEAGVEGFGVTDEQALEVGLTCGGTIDVAVFPADESDREALRAVLGAVEASEPVALAVAVSGVARVGALLAVTAQRAAGSLGGDGLDAAVTSDARGMLDAGETAVSRSSDGVAVLVHIEVPPARMLLFGGIDIAMALTELGTLLGYRVTVCDARAGFATAARFPTADEVVVAWPHRYFASVPVDGRSVVCVLTHDPKFDVPLLVAALRSPAGYIGLMGSRATQLDRRTRLRAEGVDDRTLQRLRAPIGLDLGARTPAETAVSIAAEIIALRRGGSGIALRETTGAIHAPRLPA